MKLEIFGRPGCPWCDRAKELAAEIAARRDDFSFTYIDIWAEKLTKEDLSAKAGVTVTTVPQIFLDGVHLGGCTDFQAYAEREGL